MAIGTALAIGLTLSAIGTTAQVVGGIKAGNAAKKAGEAGKRAADSSADLSDFNAQVADLQANDALERGAEEESRFRTMVRGAIGSQRAGFAAANVDVNYGSALDVQGDAAFLGELDALQIRTNAAREAWGYQVEAVDYRQRAEIQRREGVQIAEAGRVQQSASRLNAVSAIAGTGASLLEAQYGFGRTARPRA